MGTINAIIIIVVTILLSAFFSGSETALISCSRIRMRNLAKHGSRRARMVERLLESPEQFFSIVLVGTNLAVIMCTITATALAIENFGQAGVLIATLVMTPLLLVFGEVVPKAVYLYHADRIAMFVAPLLKIIFYIMWPVVIPVTWLAERLTGSSDEEERKLNIISTREELIFLYNRGRDGASQEEFETKMIDRMFKFRVVRVRDLMVPMDDVVSFSAESSIDEIVAEVGNYPWSRFPIISPEDGSVAGIISTFDLLGLDGGELLSSVMHKPFFSRQDEYAERLLISMKKDPLHLAVVEDDDGRPLGIVTLEDVLENIIGDIAT
ncbi:MAG: DUF21 domain-containing protein [Candidatus Krumholzibacteria bacterium]|nr:DUF21 domain-containing protein [Candidatus Krumholzibacteria bacterium]